MDVLTLFPEMFAGFLNTGVIGKALANKLLTVNLINFREYSEDKHRTVDDTPYGGGGGMVLKPQPIFSAVESVLSNRDHHLKDPRIVLLSPQGEPFHQAKATELAKEDHLLFLCGRYEGFDERVRKYLATDELSLGDYVLTGGELPGMVILDAVARLLPGVLGNETSAVTDSFSDGLLEHPHYTKPAMFRDLPVPDVLLSGNHAEIAKWRRTEAIRRTFERRPELLADIALTQSERELIKQLAAAHKKPE